MSNKRVVLLVVALFALFAVTPALFTSSVAFAQGGDTGGVAGIVKDASGAVVTGASIQLYSEQTKEMERTAVTGATGGYDIGSLRPGRYRLEVSANGFRKVRCEI